MNKQKIIDVLGMVLFGLFVGAPVAWIFFMEVYCTVALHNPTGFIGCGAL